MTKAIRWLIAGILGIAALTLSSAPLYVHAQTTETPAFPITLTPYNDINPGAIEKLDQNPNGKGYPGRLYTLDDPQMSDIPLLIDYAIKFFLGLVGATMIFFFMAGAFEYIWMPTIEKKQEGKNRMVFAVIGFIIILLSYVIVDVVVQVIF